MNAVVDREPVAEILEDGPARRPRDHPEARDDQALVEHLHQEDLLLDRVGIEGCAHRGAHIFRHSLATELLRSDATLTEIGQLLRHESPDTTRIYAKVDIEALRRLSPPWPGGAQ